MIFEEISFPKTLHSISFLAEGLERASAAPALLCTAAPLCAPVILGSCASGNARPCSLPLRPSHLGNPTEVPAWRHSDSHAAACETSPKTHETLVSGRAAVPERIACDELCLPSTAIPHIVHSPVRKSKRRVLI